MFESVKPRYVPEALGRKHAGDPVVLARLDIFFRTSVRLFLVGCPLAALWLIKGVYPPVIVIAGAQVANLVCRAAVKRGGRVEFWGVILLILLLCVIGASCAPNAGMDNPGKTWMVATLLLALASILWMTEGWITALRRANLRHSRREEALRQALHLLPEGFLLLERVEPADGEPDFQIAYANPAAAEFLGRAPEQGARVSELLPGPRGIKLRRGFDRVRDSQQTFRNRGLLRSGEEQVFDITATHWEDGVAVSVHDVTTRAHIEEQLRSATRASGEANRAKSHFLANMSHEFRTPMNGIIGVADLALETPLNEEQRDYLETIRECAHSMTHLLNEILDLSRIESGKLELEQRNFDLEEILESLLDNLAPHAAEQRNEWNVVIDPEVPTRLVGDPNRLRQVLLNLAANAHKFTEDGEVAVRVKQAAEEHEQVRLCFEVEDTGVGIEPEAIPRLFEKFTQADSSSTRRYQGTGLGLSISREIVQHMDGQIEAQSELGKGSLFRFTACFGRGAPEPAAPEPESDLAVGLSVLIAAGNATTRRVLIAQVRRLGCWYDEAATAEEAMEKLKAAERGGESFALLLLDQDLPDQKGLELLDRLASRPGFKRLKVALLTRLGDQPDIDRAWFPGRITRMSKPVRRRVLRRVVLQLMQGGAPPESAAEPEPDGARTAASGRPRAGTPPLPGTKEVEQLRGRVLVAEDMEVNRRMVQRMLERVGVEVVAVCDGREAVEAARSGRFDLILMDCQMPEVDGYEATRQIRALPPPGCQVPIVALTASAMPEDSSRCRELGMDGFLSKPIRSESFYATIRGWLSPTRAPGE